MKCPKCNYLGFETGDTCKNCGYDFSLLTDPDSAQDPAEVDFELRTEESDPPGLARWLDEADTYSYPASYGDEPDIQLDTNEPRRESKPPVAPPAPRVVPRPVLARPQSVAAPAPPRAQSPAGPVSTASTAPTGSTEPSPRPLPLFSVPAREKPAEEAVYSLPSREEAADEPLFSLPSRGKSADEPLIKLPAAPRAPLAVRRTPESPRQRARVIRSIEPALPQTPEGEPELEFEEADLLGEIDTPLRPASRIWTDRDSSVARVPPTSVLSRLGAAIIDHLLLGSVDLAVVYFTLRVTGLGMADWSALPPLPLLGFLLFVKLSYFAAFTAVGGQTIGKMAFRIRVVTLESVPPDILQSLKRSLAGLASALPFGLGVLLVFFDSDRRALHDRLAQTRVVGLPSA